MYFLIMIEIALMFDEFPFRLYNKEAKTNTL